MGFKILTFTCAVLLIALPAAAQVDRATVTGTVHDSTGAVVEGVTITISYPATGLTRPVTSNARGAYFVTGLPSASSSFKLKETVSAQSA